MFHTQTLPKSFLSLWRQGSIGWDSQHQGTKVVVFPIIVNKYYFLFPIYDVSCVCIAWLLGHKHRSSLYILYAITFYCCLLFLQVNKGKIFKDTEDIR